MPGKRYFHINLFLNKLNLYYVILLYLRIAEIIKGIVFLNSTPIIEFILDVCLSNHNNFI